jgi:hypothetical protein
MRKAIVFDGKKWHVRRIRVIEHALNTDEKVYRCDKPISNDHPTLSQVPEVKALLQTAVAFAEPRLEELYTALQESLKVQSHYAKLLNMHDGGHRMTFVSPEVWLSRLRHLKKKDKRSAHEVPS